MTDEPLVPVRALIHLLDLAPGEYAELPESEARPLIEAELVEEVKAIDADIPQPGSGTAQAAPTGPTGSTGPTAPPDAAPPVGPTHGEPPGQA